MPAIYSVFASLEKPVELSWSYYCEEQSLPQRGDTLEIPARLTHGLKIADLQPFGLVTTAVSVEQPDGGAIWKVRLAAVPKEAPKKEQESANPWGAVLSPI